MLSPASSPPPFRGSTASPSPSQSTGTASSYSSPYSHNNDQDPEEEQSSGMDAQQQHSRMPGMMVPQGSRGGSSAKGFRTGSFDPIGMFGSGDDAVPTLGDLMLMDLEMEGSGASLSAATHGPIPEGGVSGTSSRFFAGVARNGGSGPGPASGSQLGSDVKGPPSRDEVPSQPRNAVGSPSTFPLRSIPTLPGGQGFVPSPRKHLPTLQSATAFTVNHPPAPPSPINPQHDVTYLGTYNPNSPQGIMPHGSVHLTRSLGPHQTLENVLQPNSPPNSNTSNRSAKQVGPGQELRAPGATSANDYRGGRGEPISTAVGNGQSRDWMPLGSGPSASLSQSVSAASYDSRSIAGDHALSKTSGYSVASGAGQPVASTSAPVSRPPPATDPRRTPAPRRKRPNDEFTPMTSTTPEIHALPTAAPPSAALSAASSAGTGPSVSVRRKNVSARNMGGDGSSQEDGQSLNGTSEGSDEDGNRGGSGGNWTAKGRRTDRLFASVGAGDRAHWNIASPNKAELDDLPLMIRGIKRRGAKSRVETQIKFRLCLVRPAPTDVKVDISMLGLHGMPAGSTPASNAVTWERISTFKALRVRPGIGMRRKPTKRAAGESQDDQVVKTEEDELCDPRDELLYLSSEVVCASTGGEAIACDKCIDRETKRAQSRGHHLGKSALSESDGLSPDRSQTGRDPDHRHESLMDQGNNHILSWNCGPVVKIVDGECELAARMICYSRHHKEKAGFRMTLRLRDAEGRLIASATAPTILITDDHKTSIGKGAAAMASGPKGQSLTTENLSGLASQRSSVIAAASRGDNASKRRTRDDSASLDGDVKSSSRAAKSKPYSRKSNSETRSIGSVSGILSPRMGLPSHGLSMTPLHGQSIPGSPSGNHGGHGNYFGMLPIPGSGTISPGVLIPGAEQHISPNGGFAAALPAISQRLSQWAEGSTGRMDGVTMSYRDPENGMQVDDEQWAYGSTDSQGAASYASGHSYIPAQVSMAGLQLRYSEGHQVDFGLDASMGRSGHTMRQEIEPDFDSMLNLSPNATPVDLSDIGVPGMALHNANYPVWQPQEQVGSGVPTPHPLAMASGYAGQSPSHMLHPEITRVIPPEGDVQGGTEVTILGENFTAGTMILFGKSPAVTLQLYGPTTLVCLLPPSPIGAGSVPVFVRDSLQPLQTDGTGLSVFFTYHDVSDRKLMEMALTAVGLRVTGKIVGAVEIARRIMSAPQADSANDQGGNSSGTDQGGGAVDDDVVVEEALAHELAQAVYSESPADFEQAVIRFLTVFLPDTSRSRREDRYEPNSRATLNLINREGHTLLHFASLLGFTQLCGVLLRAGANVDIHDRNGYTALAFAALAGKTHSVKCLLSAGAQVGTCTFSNDTPAMLALRGGHMDVLQFLHHASIPASSVASGHVRTVSMSNSDSSPDADNRSSATDSDSLASADRQLDTIMSPQKLTTANDIQAVRHPQRQLSSLSMAKSDTTATPKVKHSMALPTSNARPELKARSNSTASTECPPPYNPGDDASWLQRTLSHLPGSQIIPMAPHLKDYIPPTLWDKLPSAQLLIPNMPDLLRPGELLENTWQSQAWLAVPLNAWLIAQPKLAEIRPSLASHVQAKMAAPTVEERKDGRPPPRTFVRPRVSKAVRRATRARDKEIREEGRPAEDVQPVVPSTEVDSVAHVGKLKPDRMLFFFWLPVLVGAFVYTLLTTLPFALARAVLGPILRAMRSLV